MLPSHRLCIRTKFHVFQRINEYECYSGLPAEEILSTACEKNYDVLMIGNDRNWFQPGHLEHTRKPAACVKLAEALLEMCMKAPSSRQRLGPA